MLTRKHLPLIVFTALFSCLLVSAVSLGQEPAAPATSETPAAPAGDATPATPPVAEPAPGGETATAPAPSGVAPAVPGGEAPATPATGGEAPVAPAGEAAPAAAASQPATSEADSHLPAAKPVNTNLADNWKEFVHYVQIGREDAARSYAEAVAKSEAPDRDIFALAESTPNSDGILLAAEKLSKELAATVTVIRARITRGFDAERRDPATISAQIERLEGTVRGYGLAVARLKLIGEFALPQLIQKLRDPASSPRLKQNVEMVLPQMGKAVVPGLSAALATSDPELQRVLCRVLGELGYPNAAPYLKQLMDRPDVAPAVKELAQRSLVACAGGVAVRKPAAELFYDLAQKYYDRAESLLPDLRYETANVWYWSDQLGLTFKAVPRAIYCDVYAMRNARLALQHDASFYKAVSLWIAANLDKEANLPAGATDPTRAEGQPAAEYYALAGSARFLQDVLAMAIKESNSPVAIGAIQALSKTAGATNLVQPVEGGVQPLVSALTYPDRHVRFLAAVTLAEALPQRGFTGDQQVLWVLNEALRQTGKQTVLVSAADEGQRNLLKDAVRAAGYEMIDQPDAAQAMAQMQSMGAVDVAILTASPSAVATINLMRRDPLLANMPVVVAQDTPELRGLAEKDKRVVVIPAQPTAEQVAGAIKQALSAGVGKPLAEEETGNWAVSAAKAIRNLGYTRNPVFDISRCLPALRTALGDSRTPVRVAAANALAVISKAEAQQAIAGLANDPSVDATIRIQAYNALSESLRWFGNQLNDAQAQSVVEVVKGSGAQELRVAAAQALGAMNLASDKISSLFLDTAGKD